MKEKEREVSVSDPCSPNEIDGCAGWRVVKARVAIN